MNQSAIKPRRESVLTQATHCSLHNLIRTGMVPGKPNLDKSLTVETRTFAEVPHDNFFLGGGGSTTWWTDRCSLWNPDSESKISPPGALKMMPNIRRPRVCTWMLTQPGFLPKMKIYDMMILSWRPFEPNLTEHVCWSQRPNWTFFAPGVRLWRHCCTRTACEATKRYTEMDTW